MGRRSVMMLLQVNGKAVKRIPEVLKIVEVPGKLVNIITKEEEHNERNERHTATTRCD